MPTKDGFSPSILLLKSHLGEYNLDSKVGLKLDLKWKHQRQLDVLQENNVIQKSLT